MVNIKQVAKKAGVSVATISRVLNNHVSVKETTRIKVLETIRELNYRPNVLGRNLRMSASKLFLLLIPEISNPFYTEVIKGIESKALEYEYNILLCETGSDVKREEVYLDLVKSQMVDGIISMDPATDIEKLKVLAAQFAVVQCSEYDGTSEIPYVTIDHELAAYDAVNHLIQSGHKQIAMINTDKRFLYARQREEGYRRALSESGLFIDEELILYTKDISFEAGQAATKQLIERKSRPTAIFTVSDLLAIGVLKELHYYNYHVPQDFAVVGFDNISFSQMTFPELTTISQPMNEMGKQAVQILIDQINGKELENIILNHSLIKRESSSI